MMSSKSNLWKREAKLQSLKIQQYNFGCLNELSVQYSVFYLSLPSPPQSLAVNLFELGAIKIPSCHKKPLRGVHAGKSAS